MSKERRCLKFGYGYNEKLKNKPYYNSETEKKCYHAWYNMMKRCYDTNCESYAIYGYIGIRVCKKWHNFQNFANWWDDNYYEVEGEVMSLDKDILIKNNTIYMPRACCIVPMTINSLFNSKRVTYGILKRKYGKYKDCLPIKVCESIEKILRHR